MQTDGYLTTENGIRLYYQKLGSGPNAIIFPNGIYLLDHFRHLAADRALIFYDVRNRGRSDTITNAAQRQDGIHNDVEDLEAVRRHFGFSQIDLIGHSYMGLMVILYAMRYAAHVNRVVQVSPIEPVAGKEYPAPLKWSDEVTHETFSKLAHLHEHRGSDAPEEFCRKVWSILRAIYVANPANAEQIAWGRCDLENERNFLKYWTEDLSPSIKIVNLTREQLASVSAPVLIIHGTKDRSAAYGGARDWAILLPNARLITVENVAHAPWIEAPEQVFPVIATFLNGTWPNSAENVTSLDPASR